MREMFNTAVFNVVLFVAISSQYLNNWLREVIGEALN